MSRVACLLVTTVAVAALSSACTSDDTNAGPSGPDSSAPSASGSATRTPDVVGPDCADLWKVGETLPADYTECADGPVQGRQEVTACRDDTRLVVFDDALWAVTGQKVVKPDAAPLQDTEGYGAAYSECTGE